jgi:methyltransferase
MYFLLFLLLVIFQRISELIVAKKNEIWLRSRGAIEYGQAHYPVIVLMHVLFFVSMSFEYTVREDTFFRPVFFFTQLVLMALKIWVISSLGKFWNTKIFRVPGMEPVTKGPYKFVRHPNYIIVVAEIAVIPMTFNLYYTATVFSFLNALMLSIRITTENKAWKK